MEEKARKEEDMKLTKGKKEGRTNMKVENRL